MIENEKRLNGNCWEWKEYLKFRGFIMSLLVIQFFSILSLSFLYLILRQPKVTKFCLYEKKFRLKNFFINGNYLLYFFLIYAFPNIWKSVAKNRMEQEKKLSQNKHIVHSFEGFFLNLYEDLLSNTFYLPLSNPRWAKMVLFSLFLFIRNIPAERSKNF